MVHFLPRGKGGYSRFQVTGMIKGFFGIGKFGKYLFGWLDSSRDFWGTFKTI